MSRSTGPVLAVASVTGLHIDFYEVPGYRRIGRVEGLVEQPHEIAWDPDRRLMYLAHTYRRGGYGEGQPPAYEISVIDADRREVVDVIDLSPYQSPHDIEYDPNRDLIYAGVEQNESGNGIVVVDAKTRKVVGAIPLSAPNAHWLALAPDGRKVYVSHKEAGQITVVDLLERREIKTISCPGGAEEIDHSPDGRFVYVVTPLLNVEVNVAQGALNRKPPEPGDFTPRLIKIDTATDEVVGALDFDEIISTVRVTSSGDVLVTEWHFPDPADPDPAPAPGYVHVVDGATMERRGAVQTDELPFTMRCSPDGRTAYVTNLKSGTINVVDLERMVRVTDLENNVGVPLGGTHGTCYIPEVDG